MIYTDGTVAIKAGSPIVTGTGTQWKKNIHGVAPGQLICIENGTIPVSMMIRAVNSDTELVLSFNAPVTLSGAKYSIATTVPDTISDAARTMSANQGYIVYFLRAMQQWMTDTGQVEIELPNGQKVTLESIRALTEKMKDLLSYSSHLVTGGVDSSGNGSVNFAGGMGRVYRTKAGVITIYSRPDGNGSGYTTSFQLPETPGAVMGADRTWVGDNFFFAQREVFSAPPGTTVRGSWSGTQAISYAKGMNFGYPGSNNSDTGQMYIGYNGKGYLYFLNSGAAGGKWGGEIALIGSSVVFDSNGFLKKSSPVIVIHSDGNYETNDESEGAEVRRTGTGQYHITGILGYNSDGAWGVNGGVSVPKDNNGLELVYVDDRVQKDGSIIIETCHRQHAHLPERFQNWRLKEVTPEGERIFYQDGELCDLPESTRLDVRVEMPQDSVWNVKQRELAEQMEREQAEREAKEAAEQAGDTEE
ncbi:TPA: hypothetical protein ACWLTD_003340 [Morganella morganii]|uniref:phage tail fiber protein n=1 Tax=Morganella morganii TaxID=582 RepID=UPI0021AE31B0|nr:hypothetical protein [Morganella morganii]